MPRPRRIHRLGGLWRTLARTGAVGIVTLTIAAPASAGTGQGKEMFGITMGGEAQYNEETRDRDFDAVRAVGARWVRIDITWSVIQEDGPSSYDWTEVDQIVRSITDRGMKVLGTLAYTPAWARPPDHDNDKYAPDPAAFANFAAKATEHYSRMGVHHYEIWNEPNIPFWQPRPDPAEYTRVLKAAYPAIKDADPSATVLAGSTAPAATLANGLTISPIDFLKGIYAHGGGDSFDAFSHHPYCFPAYPGDEEDWSAWHQMTGTVENLRSVMVANGDGDKEIWGTEFGAPTDGPAGERVTEREQAEMITAAHLLWSEYEWAGPFMVHQVRDLGTDTSTRFNFFGLLRHNYSKKPSWHAYKNLVATLGNPNAAVQTTLDVNVGDGPRAKGRLQALAAESAGARRVRLGGNVRLRLYRRTDTGWNSVGRALRARPRKTGRFRKRLKAPKRNRLAPGIYRVRAIYMGSSSVEAAIASSQFRLRR